MSEKKWLSALKPLVHNTIMWDAFEDMINYHIALRVKELEQADNTVNLYRAQGAIASLKKLKTLRDEINAQKTQ